VYVSFIPVSAEMSTIVAVTKLYASKATGELHLHHRAALIYSTELQALERCELRVAFTRLGSAVRVATLYDFAVNFKHAIW
jgi:hypothetical protein